MIYNKEYTNKGYPHKPGQTGCSCNYLRVKVSQLMWVAIGGLPHNREQIQKALDFSSFDTLAHQEIVNGFKEKSASCNRFFRKGQIGSWRDELTETQAQQIVHDHREVMRRFGYLDESGKIVY